MASNKHISSNTSLMWDYAAFICIFILLVMPCDGFTFSCNFNPCLFGGPCAANFTCRPTVDCKVSCICNNSTSDDCPECPCVHGHCIYASNGSLSSCVCENKWWGPTCDSECPCVHGQCIDSSHEHSNVSILCICGHGWIGPTCNTFCNLTCEPGTVCSLEDDVTQETPTCIPLTETTTIPSNTVTHSGIYNVCDPAYIRRPDDERTCMSGSYDCNNGVCVAESGTLRCECDPGSFGNLCHQTCCLNCGEHGECYRVFENGQEVCNCHDHYIGSFCDIYAPPTDSPALVKASWYWWVVGTCIFVLVLLLVLLVVVPYVMWKHRVILIMKVVHYFQGYEDDDEREWDAFISYKGNTPDEEFVVKTLFPKLTREMGFNINVHFKDFIPGEAISDGIINAVEKSRRTIMVVSPHYLTSSWTKFEWQMAQQKMLERKHRIIPILLHDISDQKTAMDKNLRLILDSVTYIEWPRSGTPKQMDKFWKRIELSMPKIKNRHLSSKHVNRRTYKDNNTSISVISNGANRKATQESVTSVNAMFSANANNTKAAVDLDMSNRVEYNMIDEHEMLGEQELYDTLNEADIGSSVNCRNDKIVANTYDYTKVDPEHSRKIHSVENVSELAHDKLLQNLTSSDIKAKENEYMNFLKIDL